MERRWEGSVAAASLGELKAEKTAQSAVLKDREQCTVEAQRKAESNTPTAAHSRVPDLCVGERVVAEQLRGPKTQTTAVSGWQQWLVAEQLRGPKTQTWGGS